MPVLTPNRWTEIKWNLEERCFIVTLYVANPLPDGSGHYAAQAADRARAHTNVQAEALGATMLKNAHVEPTKRELEECAAAGAVGRNFR